ncbi:MAG: hypothetical protein F6K28_30460 [Microcoleus sp. SIO2G3]|nr:hypothetical protein [Microcoleus sp. SIO2G3]
MANHKKTNEKTLPFAGLLFLMLVFGGGIRQVGYAFDNAVAKDTLNKAQDTPHKTANQNADSQNQDMLYYSPF